MFILSWDLLAPLWCPVCVTAGRFKQVCVTSGIFSMFCLCSSLFLPALCSGGLAILPTDWTLERFLSSEWSWLHLSIFLALLLTQLISLPTALPYFFNVSIHEDRLLRYLPWDKKNSILNHILRKPQLIIGCLETLLLNPRRVLLIIKDYYVFHQWKLEWKYQMRKWDLFEHEVFKAVTLKSALTTTTDRKKIKALHNGLWGEELILREATPKPIQIIQTENQFLYLYPIDGYWVLKVAILFSCCNLSVWTRLSRHSQ